MNAEREIKASKGKSATKCRGTQLGVGVQMVQAVGSSEKGKMQGDGQHSWEMGVGMNLHLTEKNASVGWGITKHVMLMVGFSMDW